MLLGLGLLTWVTCGLDKFPPLFCVVVIGWLLVKGVGEAALLTSSSIISNSLSKSIGSSSFSISYMTTMFPRVS